MINRGMSAQQILNLLNRPVEERPYVQFRLRDEAPMASLAEALRIAPSSHHLAVLANVVGMRFSHAKSAVPALIQLLQHSDEAVRYAVADSLGKIRAPESGTALLRALHEERVPRVRAMLAAGLGAVGAIDALESLCDALRDPDPNIRQGAAWGLGELGDSRALEALDEAGLTEEDEWVGRTILTSAQLLRNAPA